MLHAGLSLQLFRKWAPDPNNMVIMPGYCVAGTVGYRILNNAKRIEFENKQFVDVKLQVQYMSFSAHADAKGVCVCKIVNGSLLDITFSSAGIMTLIKQCEPKNVVLVHGEKSKMKFLDGKIKEEFHIDCFYPANGETINIATQTSLPVDVDVAFLKRTINNGISDPKRQKLMHGTLTIREDGDNFEFKLNSTDKLNEFGIETYQIKYKTFIRFAREPNIAFLSLEEITEVIYTMLKR